MKKDESTTTKDDCKPGNQKKISTRMLLWIRATIPFLFPLLIIQPNQGFTQDSFPRDRNEAQAMRLHDWYLQSQKKLTDLKAELPMARMNTSTPEDKFRVEQINADINAEQVWCNKIETQWKMNRTSPPEPAQSFASRYGPLKNSLQSGNDPIKAAILRIPFDAASSPENTSINGNETFVFKLESVAGVYENPANKTVFVLYKTTQITRIMTYHFNGGLGAYPGSIGLRNIKTGKLLGTWNAMGNKTNPNIPGEPLPTGPGNPPYYYWTVFPAITLPPGKYEVVNSDRATWSTNSEMRNMGCAWVYGEVK